MTYKPYLLLLPSFVNLKLVIGHFKVVQHMSKEADRNYKATAIPPKNQHKVISGFQLVLLQKAPWSISNLTKSFAMTEYQKCAMFPDVCETCDVFKKKS